MSQAVGLPLTVANPSVRSDAYKLFSIVFKYPTEEAFKAYQSGEFITALWEVLSALPHTKGILEAEAELPMTIQQELGGLSLLDLEVKFNQTFEVGAPEPLCPPYEGLFRKGVERTWIMIEVAEFYKQFGLKMSTEEGKRELPDHLCPELEFLHFLAFKEAQAREENTTDLLKGYVHAQKDFLERHIMTWISEFSKKLQASASLKLFSGLGRLMEQFVSAEHEYVRTLFKQFPEDQKEPSDEVPEAGAKEGTLANEATSAQGGVGLTRETV